MEYVRTSRLLNSAVSVFCCSGVARRQLRAMAICVMRSKSNSGRIRVSTRSASFVGLPAWMSLSWRMRASTSTVTALTSASGATSSARASGAASASMRIGAYFRACMFTVHSLLYVDQLQLSAGLRELPARRQFQVRPGFVGSEPVGEAHRAAAEVAGAVAAEHAQSLEVKCRGRAIAALHLPDPSLGGAGSELADAGERRILLQMQSQRPGTVEMAFGLADEQIAAQNRDDLARRREQSGAGRRLCSG